jgi:hypothetical protein
MTPGAPGIPVSPFIDDDEPQLVHCAVLFVDILGVREMNRTEDAARHLVALDRAVRRSYRDFLDPRSRWRSSFFSDSLVLAAPCSEFAGDAFAVGGLIEQAAILQFDLSLEGFFLRGGLSLGDFHIHDGLIFGPALVAAHEVESRVAIYPRIVLDSAADDAKRSYLVAPQPTEALAPLMRDGDRRAFVDYLGMQFDDPDSDRLFALHRRVVTEKLQANRSSKRVWEKYRWVAEYHNAKLDGAPPDFKRNVNVRGLKVAKIDMTWGFYPFR